MRKETRCRHIGYTLRLTARVLLYAPSHRQDSTYHGLCYTSRGALAGTRNSSMASPHEGSIRQPIAPWANALTTELHLAPCLQGERGITRHLKNCNHVDLSGSSILNNSECMSFTNKINNIGDKGSPSSTPRDTWTNLKHRKIARHEFVPISIYGVSVSWNIS